MISYVHVTFMFDSGVILYGEIRCQSLLGVKWLTKTDIFYSTISISNLQMHPKGTCWLDVLCAWTSVQLADQVTGLMPSSKPQVYERHCFKK